MIQGPFVVLGVVHKIHERVFLSKLTEVFEPSEDLEWNHLLVLRRRRRIVGLFGGQVGALGGR